MRGITFRFVASSGTYFAQDMCTCMQTVCLKKSETLRAVSNACLNIGIRIIFFMY